MEEFTVRWTIEINAVNAEHAAELAREMQLDPASTATLFEVMAERNGSIVVVDLTPQE